MQGLHTADTHSPRVHSPRRGSVVAPHTPPASPGSALCCSVLVLNRLYMAVHVVNVRRAFALLCRELAEVIAMEEGKFATYSFDSWREMSELRAEIKQPEDDWIKAVNFEIQVPRVIRLLTFDRLPKQRVHLSRRNVLAPTAMNASTVADVSQRIFSASIMWFHAAAAARLRGRTSSALASLAT